MRICCSLALDQQQAEIDARVAETKSTFLYYNVGLKLCPELAEWFAKLEQSTTWFKCYLTKSMLISFLQARIIVVSIGGCLTLCTV